MIGYINASQAGNIMYWDAKCSLQVYATQTSKNAILQKWPLIEKYQHLANFFLDLKFTGHLFWLCLKLPDIYATGWMTLDESQ